MNKEMKTLIFGNDTYEIVDEKARQYLQQKIPNSDKGKANGVASLDNNGKVPSNQLPEIKLYDVGGEELGVVKNGGNVVINPDGTMTAPESGNIDIPIENGEAENSIQQLNNIAIGDNSVAFGINSIAGCKGYYIKSIDLLNKKIYLSDYLIAPENIEFSDSDYTDETFTTPEYEIGDEFTVVNGLHWIQCESIKSILNNVIEYVDTLPFTECGVNNNRIDEFSFSVPTKPNVGIVELAMCSYVEGCNNISSSQASHVEGSDNIVVGYYGHAEGYMTKASYSAHSEGSNTVASGPQSHTEGRNTVASGYESHAEGRDTVAEIDAAHAEGIGTVAKGVASHSEGSGTEAIGNYSHVENYYAKAIGNYSHAEGRETEAIGESSHAEGQGKAFGNNSHAEGYGTSEGLYSHAEGYNTKSIGDNSHAEGANTTSSGHYSHAEGLNVKASGEASHAEGVFTSAFAARSHVEGYGTYTGEFSYNTHVEGYNSGSAGQNAHAEGFQTRADGNNSHAEGYDTEANGNSSHAEGYGTIAHGNYQHVGGKYNITDTDSFVIIGNGTDTNNRNNVMTLSGTTGDLSISGSYKTIGADYAEFFEWEDSNINNEDRIGLLVTLEKDKIRLANSGDDVLGIITGTAGIVGDNYEWSWNNKYLTDDFGRILYEDVEEFEEIIVDINKETEEYITEKVSIGFHKHPIINPEYDSEKTYINREDRPEWDKVGMLGKIFVRDDGTCTVNGYATVGENGIATASSEKTNMRVLSRVNENIVRVLLK